MCKNFAKSANFDRLLFSYISALQKAINHLDWTIFSGIKSTFNLGGNLVLFQAVDLDPQAVFEIFQFFAKIYEKYNPFINHLYKAFKQYQKKTIGGGLFDPPSRNRVNTIYQNHQKKVCRFNHIFSWIFFILQN